MEEKGELYLVGFGPGHFNHLTFRAREVIGRANVVVGYRTYIDLVADLLEGKEIVATGMTEEIDRARVAVDRAQKGERVAIVSSGDVGIYGMAGLIFEILSEIGWKPAGDFSVEVIPGITALSAVASLVGAPLTHDFAAVSLSDLLTPLGRHREAAPCGRGGRFCDRPLQSAEQAAGLAAQKGSGNFATL
ncbi:MAG: precorrin-3B C(17)-methyltransferase (plasmid) [Candidatus Manganitrophus sp.]|nr:MAG: precorrin-3B C(17)-methyltransferase [Candidatus Manganitrophus sp.]